MRSQFGVGLSFVALVVMIQLAGGQVPAFQSPGCTKPNYGATGCPFNPACSDRPWCYPNSAANPCKIAVSIPLNKPKILGCIEGSVADGEALIEPRRKLLGGVYQTVHRNWVAELGTNSPKEAAKEIRERYKVLIESRIPEPKVYIDTPEYAILVYPSGWDGNPSEVRVPVQRLTLSVTDSAGDSRKLIAYFLNYDLVAAKGVTLSEVVFYLNGHFGCCPSLQSMGLYYDKFPGAYPGGISGAVVGRLAIRHIPVITYDDRDVGESDYNDQGLQGNLGLVRELADMRAVETALLMPPQHDWHAVHATGVSGGGERTAHYLLIHRAKLKSAYVAAPMVDPWTGLDSPFCTQGPFKANSDTFDFAYLSNFQFADSLLAGMESGVRIAFALNSREDPFQKAWFWKETVPTLKGFGVHIIPRDGSATLPKEGLNLEVGGDAPHENDNDPNGLCHEYLFSDLLGFISDAMQNAKPVPNR